MQAMNILLLEIYDKCQKFSSTLSACEKLDTLMRFKGSFVGRERSYLIKLLSLLKNISADRKRELGKKINIIKIYWEDAIRKRYIAIESEQCSTKNFWNISLPPPMPFIGCIHPLMRVMDYIIDILRPLGFHVEEGPEIETEEYNFDSLNINIDHPARSNTDTFYFMKACDNNKYLLRTHTSPVQVRVLQRIGKQNINRCNELEMNRGIRFLAPGRVYRKDEIDLTHSPMFHQVEGMVIGHEIGMHHLKGTLSYLIKSLFGQDVILRFRPSYFPFVEPGAELDIKCYFCNAIGCRICKYSGWIEILGAGLVHPNVLNKACLDDKVWTGFAFGVGIERIAMLLSQTPDLRLFFENDQRFLLNMGNSE